MGLKDTVQDDFERVNDNELWRNPNQGLSPYQPDEGGLGTYFCGLSFLTCKYYELKSPR